MSTHPISKLSILYLLSGLLLFITCKPKSKTESASVEISPQKGLLFNKELPLKKIDSFVKTQQELHKIPAVSLALIKNGQIAYFKNYGVVNINSNEPITQNAVFEAASITKPVFAYTVCKLAQKNVIDLDASLHKRFPFPKDIIERYPCYENITARHVLNHTTGLNNWGVHLNQCPGEQYGYSGQGFEYLTKALAQSFTEEMDRKIMNHLKEEVLEPFAMKNTYFIDSIKLKELCVDGHLEGKPQTQTFPESPEMAYGMHCNSLDIAKFSIGLLNRSGLTDTMSSEMFTIQTEVVLNDKEFDSNYSQGYGLGLYIRDSPYGMVFGHSGSNYDFKCLFEVYNDLKMGYVIMTNSDTGDLLNDQMANFLVEGFNNSKKIK